MTVKMTRKTSWFSDLFIFKDSTLQRLIYPVLKELVYKITAINNIGRERGWARRKKKHSQGEKKVSFTARHWGKLQLAFSSPRVILTAQKSFFDAQDGLRFFCELNVPNHFTCPLGKLRKVFSSLLIAKSTSPLLDTNFFALWFSGWNFFCQIL